MNIASLERNAAKVYEALEETDSQLIATKRCKIYIPEHYFGSFLGSIDEEIRVVGIFGMVVDDKYYATSRVCAIMAIDPSITNVVHLDGDNYMEFTFEPGDTFIKNLNLVKLGTLAYRIFDEFISKGKVPWYMSYEDMCFLFETSKFHAGADLRVDSAVLEMIASSMARKKDDKSVFYRHTLNSPQDIGKKPYDYIPLRSVAHGATNTTAKLGGSYFQEGVTSALITESERSETIEEILR